MNIKQIILFALLSAAPIAAMEIEDGDNKSSYGFVTTVKDLASISKITGGFSLCGDLTNQPSTATKWSKPKKTIIFLSFALALQAGGLLSDSYMAANLDSDQITLYNREAVAAMEPRTTSCDIQIIGCTNQENDRFEQLYNKTNSKRRQRKKRDKNLAPELHSMSDKPQNCTQACDSVENIQKCTIDAIENGRVIIKECKEIKTKKASNLWSLAFSSLIGRAVTCSMTIFAMLALYEETSGCTNSL